MRIWPNGFGCQQRMHVMWNREGSSRDFRHQRTIDHIVNEFALVVIRFLIRTLRLASQTQRGVGWGPGGRCVADADPVVGLLPRRTFFAEPPLQGGGTPQGYPVVRWLAPLGGGEKEGSLHKLSKSLPRLDSSTACRPTNFTTQKEREDIVTYSAKINAETEQRRGSWAVL